MDKSPNKKTKRLLYIGIAGVFFLGVFLHFYAPRFITEINNPILLWVTKGSFSKEKPPLKKGFKYLKVKGYKNIDISLITSDSLLTTSKGTVLLFHGIRSGKEHFTDKIKWLNKHGFNAFAMDLRAHGSSGGQHCTFGALEKYDVKNVCSYLSANGYKNIGVWGQSLGAAVAIQSMGHDKRIKYGIIESTFSHFRSITHDYVDYHLGGNFMPLTDYLITRSGEIAGFDPAIASPYHSAAEVDQPVLIVHGDQDKRIDLKYARKNFDNLSSRQKKLEIIKGANHLNVWKIGGDAYFNRVLDFLEKQKLDQ